LNIKAERPITDIFGQLIDQVTRLIRNESALARAEIGENVSKLTGNLSILVAGVVLLLPGVIILLQAIVAGLVRAGVDEPWASLIVGGLTLVIGIVCISVAIKRFKSVKLVPTHTIEQLQRDVAVVQEAGKHHDA
jgi:hypothetical protein